MVCFLSEKGLFVEKLKSERELLVFGQADYISTKFKDFDPSNRLMWKGHNRPWDYDHILPSNELSARGRGSVSRQYQDICVTWQRSIGNLVAVDLSFNRSANDSKSPSDKYQFEDSLKSHLIDENRIKSFDIQLEHTHYEEQTNQFVLAVHDRFMHIYRYWFDNLGVEGIVKK